MLRVADVTVEGMLVSRTMAGTNAKCVAFGYVIVYDALVNVLLIVYWFSIVRKIDVISCASKSPARRSDIFLTAVGISLE